MRAILQGVLLLSLSGGVSACAEIDPYQRAGVWQPLGANSANLRTMVADPRDLNWGRGGAASPGDLAGAAVARLRSDNVKPLPASAISGLRTTDTGEQQAPGQPGAAGPPAASAGVGP